MKDSDECPNCHQRTMTPWDRGQSVRRCVLCQHEETKPEVECSSS